MTWGLTVPLGVAPPTLTVVDPPDCKLDGTITTSLTEATEAAEAAAVEASEA